jgi:hypothetical protein
VLPTVLTVITNGRGTMTPGYGGQQLEIGRTYSMTALPALGFVLTNWSSNLGFPTNTVTNKAALSFLMQSNLVLTATFFDTTRPMVAIASPTANA